MTDKIKVWSWREAVLKSSLPAGAKLVLMVISTYTNDLSEGCWPAQATLAKLASLSRTSVGVHLRAAQQAGFLTVRRRMKGSTRLTDKLIPTFPAQYELNLEGANAERSESEHSTDADGITPDAAADENAQKSAEDGTKQCAKTACSDLECSDLECSKNTVRNVQISDSNCPVNITNISPPLPPPPAAGGEPRRKLFSEIENALEDAAWQHCRTQLGWGRPVFDAEWQEFCEYWNSDGGRKSNWMRAWKDKCEKRQPLLVKTGRVSPPPPPAPPPPPPLAPAQCGPNVRADAARMWQAAQDHLRQTFGEAFVRAWVSPVVLVSCDGFAKFEASSVVGDRWRGQDRGVLQQAFACAGFPAGGYFEIERRV